MLFICKFEMTRHFGLRKPKQVQKLNYTEQKKRYSIKGIFLGHLVDVYKWWFCCITQTAGKRLEQNASVCFS